MQAKNSVTHLQALKVEGGVSTLEDREGGLEELLPCQKKQNACKGFKATEKAV